MHMQVLRLVCSCLKNAPASDTWDLTSLLVNGSPASQATVEAVLEAVYSNMWALGFEAERKDDQYSLQELLDMLLFADAVGCSRHATAQLAGMLGSSARAVLEVTAPAAAASGSSGNADASAEAAAAASSASAAVANNPGTTAANSAAVDCSAAGGRKVQLRLTGWYVLDYADERPRAEGAPRRVLKERCPSGGFIDFISFEPQQEMQLQQQVCQQLEALLFVGFKLDLQQLLQPALRFLRTNVDSLKLLSTASEGAHAAIFSPRVLAAAAGASGAEILSRACVQQQLGRGVGIDSMFKDVVFASSIYGGTLDRISFDATLLQKLFCFEAGAKVAVMFVIHGTMPVTRSDNGFRIQRSFGVVLAPAYSCDV
jgi:hypothetical protein